MSDVVNMKDYKTNNSSIDMNIVDDIIKNPLQNIKDFSKDALVVVEATPLFSDSEKEEFKIAAKNMENAFKHHQIFRTKTEALISVLNDTKFPTPHSKWFQCYREMNVHQTELVSLLYNYETMAQDIKITNAEIMELNETLIEDDLKPYQRIKLECEIEKKNIHIKKLMFELKNMKRVADDRKREILMWDEILKSLEKEVISTNLSAVDPNDHQRISYTARFIAQLHNQISSGGNVDEVQNVIIQLKMAIKTLVQNNEIHLVSPFLTLDQKTFLCFSCGVPVELLKLPEDQHQIISNRIEYQNQLHKAQLESNPSQG